MIDLVYKNDEMGGATNACTISNHKPIREGSAMTKKLIPTPSDLRQLVSFNASTGEFMWKARSVSWFSGGGQHCAEHDCRVWNAKYAGKPAGSLDKSVGYLRLSVLGGKIWAQRAAWMIAFGEVPNGQIDHIDGDKLNNRIENLRVVSMADNRRNQKRPHTNSSGVIGVTWNPKNKNWNARIQVDGKTVHLGSFSDLHDAAEARKLADIKFGFHENHGRYAACGGELATEEEAE